MSQLDQLLKFLTDTLQEGKDFSVEQAPKFVQELLRWKFYEAAIWMGVGAFVFILAIVIGRCVASEMLVSEVAERKTTRNLSLVVGFVLLGIFFFVNLNTMVKVKVAPRVVLVEMVRDLIGERR